MASWFLGDKHGITFPSWKGFKGWATQFPKISWVPNGVLFRARRGSGYLGQFLEGSKTTTFLGDIKIMIHTHGNAIHGRIDLPRHLPSMTSPHKCGKIVMAIEGYTPNAIPFPGKKAFFEGLFRYSKMVPLKLRSFSGIGEFGLEFRACLGVSRHFSPLISERMIDLLIFICSLTLSTWLVGPFHVYVTSHLHPM